MPAEARAPKENTVDERRESRAGRWLSRLRPSSVRIRTKLALMLLIPVLALAGISSVRLGDSADEASVAAKTEDLVRLADTTARLIRAMQDERTQAAVQVFKENAVLGQTLDGFEAAVIASNERLKEFDAARATFADDPVVKPLLDSASKPLSRLAVVRAAAHGDIERVHLTVYSAAVSRLVGVLDHAVDEAEAPLNQNLRAAALLATADESSERLRVLSLGLVDGQPLDASYRPIMELIGDRERALTEYRRISAEGTGFESGGLGAKDARPANAFEQKVATSRSHEAIAVGHAALMVAFDARHAATTAAIDTVFLRTVERAEVIREDVTRRVLIEGGLVVFTLVLAVLIGLWLGRSVTRGLRRLRDSARRVARHELPTAVRQVDEQRDLTGLTPEEFAERTTPPLREAGSDELAEVAGAFNMVHREAIRVAAQQAMLRVHIGAMFVRLARRGHSLTGRLTAELDAAELNEQDPDQLERLFRLDHLVSLQGRANDSLLVLGGASAAKVRRSNESLSDVLRAAQSHTEHYTRVNYSTVDDGIWIKPGVVDDAVQLLAELIDNATRYSNSPATVSARFLADHVAVEVTDQGIGIAPERLARFNERLTGASPLDLESLQAMGLTVVGMLAGRHGIAVRLVPGGEKGIRVEVTIPGSLVDFEPSPEHQRRLGEPATVPVRREAPLFRRGGERRAPSIVDTEVLPVIHFERRPATAEPVEIGPDGLPRRRPMTSYGSATPSPNPPATGPIRRDPAAIGATYVAYARGLTGSRNGRNNEPRTTT
ncbi:hypothetical protein Afil01_58510 [Actinorhabdospora filicis]|uniref:histidine kinase n=1 Tax=Actinorhabdospora filicis TaxID=1785913 RepID=A0A9W6SQE4_9ACTN|nr:ATP-binding protein [Actinorhabdospora filicis]GLZ81044.1 hypothetical protein Afil01_58510 [Actinorhabdospora filicis]